MSAIRAAKIGLLSRDRGGGGPRTPVCANLILDNLDEWAAWYEKTNR